MPSAVQPTVCIVYGFAEGPRVGRALQVALTEAGFTVVQDPAQADIIFAHSGGCFVLPTKHRAKLIIFTGLSYWPGKPLLVSIAQKTWHDLQAHRRAGQLRAWLKKTGWNLVYAGKVHHNARMLRGMRQGTAWQATADRMIVVRNTHDAFCAPDITAMPFSHAKPIAIELIGEHDDCWLHPAPYVSIVKS
jgi:hypothetical protein